MAECMRFGNMSTVIMKKYQPWATLRRILGRCGIWRGHESGQWSQAPWPGAPMRSTVSTSPAHNGACPPPPGVAHPPHSAYHMEPARVPSVQWHGSQRQRWIVTEEALFWVVCSPGSNPQCGVEPGPSVSSASRASNQLNHRDHWRTLLWDLWTFITTVEWCNTWLPGSHGLAIILDCYTAPLWWN